MIGIDKHKWFKRFGRTVWSIQPPDDPGFIEIIRRHLHLDAVTHGQADKPLAHFAGDGGENEMFIVQFNAKHSAGQDDSYVALDFNGFLFHGEGKQKERFPAMDSLFMGCLESPINLLFQTVPDYRVSNHH